MIRRWGWRYASSCARIWAGTILLVWNEYEARRQECRKQPRHFHQFRSAEIPFHCPTKPDCGWFFLCECIGQWIFRQENPWGTCYLVFESLKNSRDNCWTLWAREEKWWEITGSKIWKWRCDCGLWNVFGWPRQVKSCCRSKSAVRTCQKFQERSSTEFGMFSDAQNQLFYRGITISKPTQKSIYVQYRRLLPYSK